MPQDRLSRPLDASRKTPSKPPYLHLDAESPHPDSLGPRHAIASRLQLSPLPLASIENKLHDRASGAVYF